jgi:predicted PurR-regulated permease PerM
MHEDENPQRDSQAQAQAHPETTPTEPDAPMPSEDAGWAGASPTQVMRTVAVALLTAAVVLGAFFLLWQVRTFIGWFVIALFLAAVLNPAVNWLQRRHRLMKRPLAIGLTYLGVLVALLLVVGIFVPVLVDQINGFIKFVNTAANAPEGPTKYIEGLVNAGVGLFPERHQPLVRRLLSRSAGAISGYITGNLAISVICGITTFIVLLLLGMPYAAPLALLVAVLDLIPLVGATLGGALLVVVGLFVEPWKAVVLLVYIVVYQQAEGSVLQPLVYSKAVQLNGLVILIALLVGGQLLGIPGALLAIPVAEIIRIVITELLAYRRTAREAKEPAVAASAPPTKGE